MCWCCSGWKVSFVQWRWRYHDNDTSRTGLDPPVSVCVCVLVLLLLYRKTKVIKSSFYFLLLTLWFITSLPVSLPLYSLFFVLLLIPPLHSCWSSRPPSIDRSMDWSISMRLCTLNNLHRLLFSSHVSVCSHFITAVCVSFLPLHRFHLMGGNFIRWGFSFICDSSSSSDNRQNSDIITIRGLTRTSRSLPVSILFPSSSYSSD